MSPGPTIITRTHQEPGVLAAFIDLFGVFFWAGV
jgi:hypothetical protein